MPDTVTVVDLGEPRVGLTVMASGRAVGLNVAMTATVVVIVTVQEPVPEQPPVPVQPPNVDPEAGVAVSMTVVLMSGSTQSLPLALGRKQLIPEGTLVTVPPPVPAMVTVRLNPPCPAKTDPAG